MCGMESKMALSAYQVDNVIKAYNKQSKLRLRAKSLQVSQENHMDVVSLSGSEGRSREEAYEKISYSLVDILVKDKG